MAKPFSIQSPENIAKEYAGNKQRIAEAMQMGVVDATAGVLAGMFIDRMRSAQTQEQAPQQTVAQQVMGGAPPPPPPPPSGGLGATPQAALQAAPQGAPPMAPPMDMPPEMGMEQSGMAEGGIVGLDVPSYMFDEPDNGSYAGGGLVAFAQGGGADLAAFRRAIIQQESGGRYGIPNAEGSGAMGIGQIMPDTARALAKRLGLPYRPDLLAGKDKAAQDYQIALTNEATREAWDYGDGDIRSAAAYYHAGPNKKGWGPKTAKYQNDILRRLGMDSGEGAQLPERDVDTAEGRRATFQDQIGVMGGLYGQLPDSGLGALEEYYRGELAPEKQEKARKDDMWMALAQLGANMASSKSPNFLQAAGEAIAATMPGIAGSKKERKAAEREARTGLREVLGLKRAEQKEVIDAARDLYRIELGAEGSEAEREARAADAATARQHDKDMARLGQTFALERISAEGKVTNTQFEQLAAAHRARIADRIAQGLPVTKPDGTVLDTRGGRLAASELDTLANNWALYDTNRYRAQAAGSGGFNPLGGLPPGGGGGTGTSTQGSVSFGELPQQ